MARVNQGRRIGGTITVEAAIALPLLMLMLLGLVEYGWLFLKSQQITNAARQGTRIAVLPDSVTSDVTAAVDAMMTDAGLSGSGYTTTITPTDVTVPEPGENVTVRVALPYGNVDIFNTSFIPTPTNIAGEVTMVKEGP